MLAFLLACGDDEPGGDLAQAELLVAKVQGELEHGAVGDGGAADHNHPDYQERVVKFNELVANAAIFSTALDITDAANALAGEGYPVDTDDLATVSPYPDWGNLHTIWYSARAAIGRKHS